MVTKALRTYADINKEIEALQKQAERVRQEEVAGVVARINETIATYGLKPGDLDFGSPRVGKKRKTASANGATKTKKSKYGDGTGNVWSGRGPRPRWLREALEQGKQLADFLI